MSKYPFADHQDRREFLKAGGAGLPHSWRPQRCPPRCRTLFPASSDPVTTGAMPTRNLGKTGYRWASSRWAGRQRSKRRITKRGRAIIERALDLGVIMWIRRRFTADLNAGASSTWAR